MQDEFYPIQTNAQAWKQIQNGVENRINSHIKKLLTEEKYGTRISDMKKILHSSSANFINLLKTWSHYNVDSLHSWKSSFFFKTINYILIYIRITSTQLWIQNLTENSYNKVSPAYLQWWQLCEIWERFLFIGHMPNKTHVFISPK